MIEKVSRIHQTYLLDQQLSCWRHFSKTEGVQNTDLNILALYEPSKDLDECASSLVQLLLNKLAYGLICINHIGMYVSYIELALCLQCGVYPTRAFVYRSARQLAC